VTSLAVSSINLDKLKGTPVYDVIRDYCESNSVNVQDIDALDNFEKVVERLRKCLESCDFRAAGSLILLGHILIRIQSEKILIKNMDEEDRRKFIAEHSRLYRLDIDKAINNAVLSLLSRRKVKILVEGHKNMTLRPTLTSGSLNRRRETTVDDVRNVVQDDDAFRDIYVARVRGEQRKKESVSSSMIVDFDMDRIQNDLRSFLKPGENIRLDEVDMDYLDAFMATLFLAQRGEVSVFQEDFGKPIFLVS